jgi:hypothetical protein
MRPQNKDNLRPQFALNCPQKMPDILGTATILIWLTK